MPWDDGSFSQQHLQENHLGYLCPVLQASRQTRHFGVLLRADVPQQGRLGRLSHPSLGLLGNAAVMLLVTHLFTVPGSNIVNGQRTN